MLNFDSLSSDCNAALFDHLPDAIVLFDHQGHPLVGNQAAIRWLSPYLSILRHPDPNLPDCLLNDQHRPLAPNQLPLQRILAGETLEDEVYILISSNDATKVQWMAISGRLCSPSPAQPLGIAGILSVRNLAVDRPPAPIFRQQSDDLTGLPNRNALIDYGNALLSQGRSPHTLALLLVDLDRFKEVNDNLGHGIGNQLLAALGKRLQQEPWRDRFIARLGSDEFAVVLEDLHQPEDATALAEQLHLLIAAPFPLRPQDIYLDASIGIAPGTDHYRHAED